jgi:hypothetical protein
MPRLSKSCIRDAEARGFLREAEELSEGTSTGRRLTGTGLRERMVDQALEAARNMGKPQTRIAFAPAAGGLICILNASRPGFVGQTPIEGHSSEGATSCEQL